MEEEAQELPKKIFLQPAPKGIDVTWAANRINVSDVEYIRSDIIEAFLELVDMDSFFERFKEALKIK